MINKLVTRNHLKATDRLAIWLAVFSLMVTMSAAAALAGPAQDANSGRGGQPLELKSLAVPGKVTLIDCYSPFCPPCLRLAPLLEQLAEKRSDLVVLRVNINRPGVNGIDWQSPLARQYGLKSIPHFVIFSPEGKLKAEGGPAAQQVSRWLRDAGLLKN